MVLLKNLSEHVRESDARTKVVATAMTSATSLAIQYRETKMSCHLAFLFAGKTGSESEIWWAN
jgi:hypothetical protein